MFASLKVAHRLGLLVALFSVLLIAIGAMGLVNTAHTLAGLKTVYEDRTVALAQLAQVDRLLLANFTEILRAIQHNPGQELAKLHDHPVEEHLKRLENNLASIDKEWQAYMSTFLTPEEKELASQFEGKYRRYTQELTRPTMDALRKGDYSVDVTSRFLKGNRQLGGEVEIAAQTLIKLQIDEAKKQYETSIAAYERTRLISITAIALGLAFGCLIAWWLIRSVTGPLNLIRDAVGYVRTSGDFTRTVACAQQDEVGETARAFNELFATLRSTLGDLLQAVDQVGHSAANLADNSHQAAQAAGDTSESASSMAAAVEQMTVSINQVGEGTRDALKLARQAGQLSSAGGEVIEKAIREITQIADTVRRVSETIDVLGKRSEGISNVVQVIKDVAEQTNLLALNAAIEAARAGEAGRGFAVVADEVRKLAERTTQATGEIGSMISEIQGTAHSAVTVMGEAVSQVDAGVQLAGQAGDAIAQIRSSTADVVGVVTNMSEAIIEQGSTSHAIASQVERVAQAAEENSASAGQSSRSARELDDLANQMRSTASRFKI